MFKDIRFLVHTSVQAADDVAITIQNHRGRVVLTLAGADVVLVDRDRCASIPVAAHAEVIHYTWVDLCLKHGLRLPYTYSTGLQACIQRGSPALWTTQRLQDYTRPVGDSSPAMSRDESSPLAHRSATSSTIAGTEDDIGRRSAFEHSRSSREVGILPVPCPSILGFNARGGKNHPPELRDYFEHFLTAIWTLEPSRRLDMAMQDLLQILPNLSVYSLRSFEKTQQHRVQHARMNGLAASRSGVAAGATVEGEVKKLLKALASVDATRSASGDNGEGIAAPRRPTDVRPRETSGIQLSPLRPKLTNPTGKWGHQRLGLDARIGGTTVQALLNAPDLPALPTDDHFESKYAFYDAVLQWVLEREPTATRFPINSFVYELGGRKMFTERSFESSYKLPARIARYKQIRQSVLDRWRSGELGTLSKHDEETIRYIDHVYGRPRITRRRPLLARVRSGGATTRSGDRLARLDGIATTASTRSPSPRGHADPAVYGAPSAGAAESGGNGNSVDDTDDETEDEHHEESRKGDSDGDDGMDVFMFDDGEELKETQDGDVDPDSDSVPATAPDPTGSAQENPTRAVFPELDEETALYDLVQSFLWFEDYAALHKLDTEARAAKRATIWQHMAIKFKHGTDEYWEAFYESNQAEIERRVQASRVRPVAKRSFYY